MPVADKAVAKRTVIKSNGTGMLQQKDRLQRLLVLENGKVKKIHYGMDRETPYGTLQENLIK